jgi:hypothetical protein
MTYKQNMADMEKESILAKALECDICRTWLSHCMAFGHYVEAEKVEREAYYEKYKEHIENCPNR